MPDKPLTAKEAYAITQSLSSPEMRARRQRLIATGCFTLSDEPDFIVGGKWPSRTADAVRRECALCGRAIALCPDSGLAMAERFPEVLLFCFPCAEALSIACKEL